MTRSTRTTVTDAGGEPFLPLAVTAAAGVGLVAGLVGAAVATLLTQANATVRDIEQAAIDAAVRDGFVPPSDSAGQPDATLRAVDLPVPRADGLYQPDGLYRADSVWRPDSGPVAAGLPAWRPVERPIVLAMLGDSTAVGYGTRDPKDLPGVGLASGIAAGTGRAVRLVTHGRSGCGAADLQRQLGAALGDPPDLVVIVIGGNDIRDKVPPSRSAQLLGEAVATLRAHGVPVVVGTCPDFGVIEPIPQPLRMVLHSWSRLLATLQARSVLAAGGRPVAIGRLVSPGFAHHPELFAGDRFHPSGAGYARAVAALLPVALEALNDDAQTTQASAHQALRSADLVPDPPRAG